MTSKPKINSNVSVRVDDASIGTTFEDTAQLTVDIQDVNEAPSVELTNTVSSIAENTSSQTKIADIVISDDALGSETLTVIGSDAALFEIIDNELFLKANQNIDFETQSTLNITVVVDDPSIGNGPDSQTDHNLTVIDVNELPSVTLSNQISVLPENFDTSGPTKIADIEVNDDALGDESLFLTGADRDDFEIIGSELFLKAGTLLDFETQNSLNIVVEIDDPTLGSGSDDSATQSLNISDVNESPQVSLLNSVTALPENFDTSTPVKVADINVADDALGVESLTLSGPDSGLFEIIGSELFLRANTALDFEAVTNLNVTVEVDDASIGTGIEDSVSLSLAILDVNEAPTVTLINQLSSIDENTSTRTKIADVVVTDDALGSESLSLSGADASLFELVGTELFLIENAGLDHETSSSLDVTVSVDDPAIGASVEDSASLTLAVADVNEAPDVVNQLVDINTTEDSANLVVDLTNVFEDVDLDSLTLSLDANSDPSIASAEVVGNSLIVDFLDDQSGTFTLEIAASDGEFTATDSFTVNVAAVNDAPILSGGASLTSIFRGSDPNGDRVGDLVDPNVFRHRQR